MERFRVVPSGADGTLPTKKKASKGGWPVRVKHWQGYELPSPASSPSPPVATRELNLNDESPSRAATRELLNSESPSRVATREIREPPESVQYIKLS